MTPLDLEIILYYNSHLTDFRNGELTAPAVASSIKMLLGEGILIRATEPDFLRYTISEKGRFYVDALCSLPLPVATWIIPTVGDCRKALGGVGDEYC